MGTHIDKKELQNGKVFTFDNQAHQVSIEDDNIRTARVWLDGANSGLPNWAHGFKILFNGSLLHSSKTFRPMERRLNSLVDTWKLEPINYNK